MTEQHGLGRIPSKPHPRMAEFPVEAILTPQDRPRSYTWDCDLWLDQGRTSMCVGFSGAHEAAARPVERKATRALAEKFYGYAQQHDYWPGEGYDGTSVDGGMQAMREFGYIESWWWARNLETTLIAIGHRGPAIIGVDWWTGMFAPDSRGYIHPTGAKEGGHATVVRQVRLAFKAGTPKQARVSSGWSLFLDHDRSYVGIHNSWGADWQPQRAGEPIPVRMSIPEFSQILTDGGECAIPVGRKRGE